MVQCTTGPCLQQLLAADQGTVVLTVQHPRLILVQCHLWNQRHKLSLTSGSTTQQQSRSTIYSIAAVTCCSQQLSAGAVQRVRAANCICACAVGPLQVVAAGGLGIVVSLHTCAWRTCASGADPFYLYLLLTSFGGWHQHNPAMDSAQSSPKAPSQLLLLLLVPPVLAQVHRGCWQGSLQADLQGL